MILRGQRKGALGTNGLIQTLFDFDEKSQEINRPHFCDKCDKFAQKQQKG